MSSPVAEIFVIATIGTAVAGASVVVAGATVAAAGVSAAASALNSSRERRRRAKQREQKRLEEEARQRQLEREAERKREQAEKRFAEEQRRKAEQQAREIQRQKEIAEKKRIAELKRQEELAEKRRKAEQEAREARLRQEKADREWKASIEAQSSFNRFADERMKSVYIEQIRISRDLMLQFSEMYTEYSVSDSDGNGQLSKSVNDFHRQIKVFVQKEKFSETDSLKSLEDKKKKWDDALDVIRKKAENLERMVLDSRAEQISDIMSRIGEDINETDDVSFIATEEKSETSEASLLSDSIAETLAELAETPDLPEEYRKRIEASEKQLQKIEDLQLLKNFNALTVIPLKNDIGAYAKRHEQELTEFEKLVFEYEALCSLKGVHPVETDYSAAMVPFLKNEIARIEAELEHEDEQEYIHKCLDEVMQDMGYEVIGRRNINKKTGKRFTSDLYSFSDGTAVNIVKSDDGMVSMEFGGIDTVDRSPDDYERNMLAEEAETFCDKQKEIESRLAEKGIVVGKRISLIPPDGAYAQIINISDYDLEKTPEVYQVRKKKRTSGNIHRRIE